MKNRFFLLLFGWTMGCALAGLAAEAEKPWEVRALTKDGEVEYNLQTGRWVGSNGVGIKYGETELTAGRIQLDETTGQVQAEGLVTLQQDGQLWKGDRLQYNFKTRQIQADEYKTGKVPYFASGFGLSGEQTNANYRAYYSSLTTDDVDKPGYTIRAKTLIVSPGNYIEARQATVYLGKVPVFYWPYYRRSLQRHPNNIVLTPGYRSRYGPYMLGTYNWYANDNLQGAFNMDYRQKRGVGGGPDLYYDLGKAGSGDFRYYVTRDEDAPLNSVAKQIDDERQRIQFTHKVTLRTNLTAKAVVRYQTDEYFIRDFFEKEYRENIQPSTFLEVNQLWSNFSLNVLAQPQINDFFDTVERLPDIKFTGMRQQLGNSPLYYESESSLGYYRHQFGNNAFPEYAAFRSDTFHQVVLPQTFFGWLNVVPRVGGRWTHYGDSEGPGIPFTEHDRGVFNTGAEISMK
ncbi:MAG TPA: hypothetical protein VK968_19150, partial [Roseimicrobium sp.]|nr:hypothetical protein [Roseimicrobium sp.]